MTTRLIVSLFVAAICAGFLPPLADASGSVETGRYIVFFKETVDHPGQLARSQAERHSGKLGFVYRHALLGYSAALPKAEVAELKRDPNVSLVVPDHQVEAAAQTISTGISRSFANANPALDIDGENDIQTDADIAVIDTGTDQLHPDLKVVARTDCSNGTEAEAKCIDESGADTTGHGTHVAGTAAALDNGAGIVGVAAGARVWAVKVLETGLNFDSEIAAGVDWVTARAGQIDVANMSLECNCSLHATATAIEGSVDAGVVYVVAAGNNFIDAKSVAPANHPDVIAVSALADFDGQPGGEGEVSTGCRKAYEKEWGAQKDDASANLSNWGEEIDIAAPGICILSTFPGGNYTELWGTSTASPHVAGAAAILASQANPENRGDVEAIREEIVNAGSFEWEDLSEDEEQEPLLDVGDDEVFSILKPPKVTTKSASAIGLEGATLNATVDPEARSTTYQFEYGKTTSYGSKVPIAAESVGSGGEPVEVDEKLEGLKPNQVYHFRIVATNEVGASVGDDAVFSTVSAETFGTQGTGTGQFSSPAGIARDPEGNIWVADTVNDRIQKFSAAGAYLSQFGKAGSGSGEFSDPAGLVVDPKGNIWVADTGNSRVQKFNSKGEFLLKFGSEGSAVGQLKLPHGVAVDPEGYVWVTDANNHRVQRFNPEGKFPSTFGSKGTGNSQLDFPTGIGIATFPESAAFVVWVADTNNNRIQKLMFSGAGITSVGRFGSKGSGDGEFNGPRGVGFNPEGHAWIADAGNHRIQKFGSSGQFLEKVGSQGSSAGQFKSPAGIAPNPEGDVWIADAGNHRIQKWLAPAQQPTAETEPASKLIAPQAATLNATVNPKGTATTYQFEYGETTEYGSKAPASPKSIGSESRDVAASEAIEGLTGETTYHFRVVASSAEGTVYGEDRTFTTKANPTAHWLRESEALEEPEAIELEGSIGWTSKSTSWICEVEAEATLVPEGEGEVTQFELDECWASFGGFWCLGESTSSTVPWPVQATYEEWEYEIVGDEVGFEIEWPEWCPEQKPWKSSGELAMSPDSPGAFSELEIAIQPEGIGAQPSGLLEATPAGMFGMEAF